MKNKPSILKYLRNCRLSKARSAIAITLLTAAGTNSFAAAFMLQEQNAVQTGDFGAGMAAIAEDASTAWFNPAGLVRVTKPQIVLSGNEIWFGTSYTGTVTQSESIFDTTSGVQNVNNAQGGTSNFLPTFHASYPINQNVVAGFSVTTPFGLSTDYSTDTFVRYSTTETKLRTIDLSPSLGVKLTPKLSVGAGFDEQRLLASFESYAGLPGFPGVPETEFDSLSKSAASDWAPAWHAGILYQPTNETRIGLAYHSKVVHHASGYSTLSGVLADPDLTNPAEYATNNATTSVYFPASTTLSAYHEMSNSWAVMGTVIFTQWDIFKQLALSNLAGLDATGSLAPINVTIPQNFHNTWRVSVGTNYKVNNQWLVRSGLGYDQSPTNNIDRNLRLPDGNRFAVSLGGRYQATPNLAFDGGFTHQFIASAGINNTGSAGPQTVTVTGNSHNYANVLGFQITYSFA